MTMISPQRDRKEYFRQQAEIMRRRVVDLRKAGNDPEANRIEKLAEESDKTAQGIEEQLRNAGK